MKIGSTVIRTIQGDITKVDFVTAIVNAANRSLLGGLKKVLLECVTLLTTSLFSEVVLIILTEFSSGSF